jgi:hypothetical protein
MSDCTKTEWAFSVYHKANVHVGVLIGSVSTHAEKDNTFGKLALRALCKSSEDEHGSKLHPKLQFPNNTELFFS